MPVRPFRYRNRVGALDFGVPAILQCLLLLTNVQTRQFRLPCTSYSRHSLFGGIEPPTCPPVLFPVPGSLARFSRPMTVSPKVNAL